MPYLFHERVLSTPPSRATAMRPGVALAFAILGTTAVSIALALIAR